MATEPAIGTRIKRARERLRWTQKRLAVELGVSQKTVDNWEHGRTAPKSSIGALEEVLGVRLDGTADVGGAAERGSVVVIHAPRRYRGAPGLTGVHSGLPRV
jgi:transcriptional regulator with XRE-family HTH domain